MRPWKVIASLLILFYAHLAHATFMNMSGTTFTFGYWDEDNNRRGFRVAPRWDWDVNWLQGWPIELTGYWEAGVGYWRSNKTESGQNGQLYIFSGSPILQIWVGEVDLKRNAVFFEIGVGPAYLSQSSLGKIDLGSHWHFEDKFGVGLNFDTENPVQLIYRYYHYSNAGFKEPNRGLDLHTFGVVWFF